MPISCKNCQGKVVEDIEELKRYQVPTDNGRKDIQVPRFFNMCSSCGNAYVTASQKVVNASRLIDGINITKHNYRGG